MSNKYLFVLPNILSGWPWPRALNPHYAIVKSECSAWFEGFRPFANEAQIRFNKCDFSLLTSLGCPLSSKDHLRTSCDVMNLFFLIDEFTDVKDEGYAAMVMAITMDALRNPLKSRPHGEVIIGEVARQLWARSIPIITESSRRRFIDTFETYLESVVLQASDRSKNYVRSVGQYFLMRRENIGAKPSFVMLEFALNIPDYVMSHPSVRVLTECTIDLIIISNDLCSYKVEHGRGDDIHNLITVVRNEFGYGLNDAIKWIESYSKVTRATFLSNIEKVPSWSEELDEQVTQYIYGLANWVRGNDCWSYESERYFGIDGRMVQKHRIVDLECGHRECTQVMTEGIEYSVWG